MKQQGFTLVELLVTVAIIAILAVVGLTVFSGAQNRARDAKIRQDVQSIANALEANYDSLAGTYSALNATMFAGNSIPTHPTSGSNYGGSGTSGSATCYTVSGVLSDGSTYSLSCQQ